jgi:hypothetical protein
MMRRDYEIYKVGLKYMCPHGHWNAPDERVTDGYTEDEISLTIIAPGSDFGEKLLRLHLEEGFKYVGAKLPSGATHEVLEITHEKIDRIISFESEDLIPL